MIDTILFSPRNPVAPSQNLVCMVDSSHLPALAENIISEPADTGFNFFSVALCAAGQQGVTCHHVQLHCPGLRSQLSWMVGAPIKRMPLLADAFLSGKLFLTFH